MNERQPRARVSRWKRILAPPLIALALLGAALFVVGCSEDVDEQQASQMQQEAPQEEQPSRALQRAQSEQQQASMQQEEAQQEAQQAYQEQQAEQAAQEAEYAEAEQEAEAAEESEQEAASTSPPSRQQRQQRSSEAQQSSEEQQAPRRSLPGATNFEDYPTIGWRETAEDDTSTFSLDVDRTSYFLALNWVEAGYAIEPASVRAEEWINAFDYRYELPEVDDSFAVTTDLVGHPLHSNLHLVRIATQAPEFVDNTPLNVTLVLDSSGSMDEGNRVEIARQAAHSIRRGLSDDDRIAVVLFSSGIVSYREHEHPDHWSIEEIIDTLTPRSSTNVQAGINLGVELADDIRRERPDAYNYVILMSDGVANVDATDPFAILQTAEDRDDRNPLRLITVGVGIANYNDVLLEQLAQHGNGWYRYLQDVEQARSTFSRENWLALSIPFADQTRAQVRWDEDSVVAWRLVGYENRVTSDRSFEEDRKEFAEIPMGSATTMFFEVELSDETSSSKVIDLGEIELRWVTPMSDQSNRQQVGMSASIASFGDDAMLDLGSVVALAADRYSWFGQDGLSEETMSVAAEQLAELADWYEALPDDILDAQSGEDFGKLLVAMSVIAEDYESEDPGYSR